MKRLFDILVAAALVAILAPMLAFVALAVKLGSPGPVIYRGTRTGLHGRTFAMFKFRTMYVQPPGAVEGTTALNDARITPTGHFLRRYKLDELPQLFNVLRGEMSLVGPRPELPRYTNLYQGDEQLILSVRPGITDYSSIRFAALDHAVGAVDADGEFERKVLPEKNRLRIKYARESSMLVDLKILWATVVAVLRK